MSRQGGDNIILQSFAMSSSLTSAIVGTSKSPVC